MTRPIPLAIACGDYDRTRPLFDGREWIGYVNRLDNPTARPARAPPREGVESQKPKPRFNRQIGCPRSITVPAGEERMRFISEERRGLGQHVLGSSRDDRWILRVCVLMCVCVSLLCLSWRIVPTGESAEAIPIFDAHNQYDNGLTAEEIISLMDAAGVQRTFFSSRGRGEDFVLQAGSRYPKRILPLITTKGPDVERAGVRSGSNANLGRSGRSSSTQSATPARSEGLGPFLQRAVEDRRYYGIAELLVFHTEKDFNSGVVMPQRAMMPDDPIVELVAGLDASRNWPLLLHIEFGQTGDLRQTYMEKFEQLLKAHPNLPMVLMHMGQLDPDEAGRLIVAHQNLYLLTGRVSYGGNGPQINPHTHATPSTVMFQNGRLLATWRELFVKYPDRFIFAIDNVQLNDWRNGYVKEVTHWRRAFADLPPDVANQIAHQNAERLWHLPSP